MDAVTRLRERRGGVVLFALTPPRLSTPADRVTEIAKATMERLRPLGLDGLILYDIDDESSRNPVERPFPFSPTLDPADFARNLEDWPTPVVILPGRRQVQQGHPRGVAGLAGLDAGDDRVGGGRQCRGEGPAHPC